MENLNNIKISCIIPAYNEERGIGLVLQALMDAGDVISEVIVVDDGSKDKTVEIVKKFLTVKLIQNKQNMGKSATIANGIEISTGSHVLFLDADLAGLNSTNIVSLVNPIIKKEADVVLSMRSNTPSWMKKIGVDFMVGERVIPKSMFSPVLNEMKALNGFGLEVYMNRILIKNKFRIKSVMMPNVKNIFKWQKTSFWSGVKGEMLMWVDVFKIISPVEFVIQNIELRKLLVK